MIGDPLVVRHQVRDADYGFEIRGVACYEIREPDPEKALAIARALRLAEGE